jgi:hypothetical protein
MNQATMNQSLITKVATVIAVAVFILMVIMIANQTPPPLPPGSSFILRAQKIIQCSPNEITIMDNHFSATHLDKDASWPDCSTFHKDDVLDFYLLTGEKAHFVRDEKTTWWRKAM